MKQHRCPTLVTCSSCPNYCLWIWKVHSQWLILYSLSLPDLTYLNWAARLGCSSILLMTAAGLLPVYYLAWLRSSWSFSHTADSCLPHLPYWRTSTILSVIFRSGHPSSCSVFLMGFLSPSVVSSIPVFLPIFLLWRTCFHLPVWELPTFMFIFLPGWLHSIVFIFLRDRPVFLVVFLIVFLSVSFLSSCAADCNFSVIFCKEKIKIFFQKEKSRIDLVF